MCLLGCFRSHRGVLYIPRFHVRSSSHLGKGAWAERRWVEACGGGQAQHARPREEGGGTGHGRRSRRRCAGPVRGGGGAGQRCAEVVGRRRRQPRAARASSLVHCTRVRRTRPATPARLLPARAHPPGCVVRRSNMKTSCV